MEPPMERAIRLFQQGERAAAEKLFRKIAKKPGPNQALALRYLAIIASQKGDQGDALKQMNRALALLPRHPLLHYELGVILKASHRPDEAERAYTQAIELDPGLVQAHFNLGNLRLQRGDEAGAIDSYQQALALEPGHQPAFVNLGLLLDRRGDTEALGQLCQRFGATHPDSPHLTFFQGRLHHRQERYPEAIEAYSQTLARQPDFVEAHVQRALARRQLGHLDEALTDLQAAAKRQPSAAIHHQLGALYHARHDHEQARHHYEEALALQADHLDTLCNLAELLEKGNHLEEARRHIDHALEIAPDHAAARRIKATLLRRGGQIEEAIELLKKTEPPAQAPTIAVNIQFELGQLLDRQGEVEEAMTQFNRGNALLARIDDLTAERQAYLDRLERLNRTFTREWVDGWRPITPGSGEEASPVFIVGFPRSGTTLLGQMLAAHPDIRIIEEEQPVLVHVERQLAEMGGGYPDALADLSDEAWQRLRQGYLQRQREAAGSGAGGVVIEKLPLNLIHAGLIQRLFPSARFLLALRHPCDACLSCFMQPFSPNAAMANFYSLADSVRFYEKVMGLWQRYNTLLPLQVHAIRYETLISDFQQEIGQTLRFIGLDWDEAVSHYNEQARQRGIFTPSYSQVVQPLYTSARYRWHKYRAYFQPHLQALQPFIETFGYGEQA